MMNQSEQHIQIISVPVGKHVFTCRVAGLDNNGDTVVLLHGFPETSLMWESLMYRLVKQGLRVIAPDQRGYTIGTVNSSFSQFHLSSLAQDVFSLVNHFSIEHFHLVGHDWGASVGWFMVSLKPKKILSWSALSVPHLYALQRALKRDKDQRRRTRYMLLFRLPRIAARALSFNRYAALKKIWQSHSEREKEEYLSVFSQPGILMAALTWYKANLSRKMSQQPSMLSVSIDTPSQLIWGKNDVVVGRYACELSMRYMAGPYQFIQIDAGHWLMQEAFEPVASAIESLIEKNR